MDGKYDLPKGWKVWRILTGNPFLLDFKVIATQKEEVVIFSFDGISETPTMIETYHSRIPPK